jgi:hypothetical protein
MVFSRRRIKSQMALATFWSSGNFWNSGTFWNSGIHYPAATTTGTWIVLDNSEIHPSTAAAAATAFDECGH